jgi:uncharacterized BrkB/YihY/UPF0761 family membrane protein
MTLKHYLKEVIAIALANGLALAVTLAIAMAVVGDTNAQVDADIGFERLDGLWLVPGLPITLVVLALLLSPLAFALYRLLRRLPGLRPE